MIEVNLIPDVKREYLRAQRMRNMVVSASIMVMIVAGSAIAVLGVGLGAVSAAGLVKDGEIKSGYRQLSGQSGVNDIVTIQNQLAHVSELDKARGINSRVCEVVSAVNPPAPNNIKISTIRFKPSETSIAIDGSAANSFTATDIMKKTILNTKIQYRDDSSTKEVPLASEVTITNTTYAQESDGSTALHFTLTFSYPKELTSNEYKNVTIVTPTSSIDVTDSKTHVPDGLFSSNSSKKEEK